MTDDDNVSPSSADRSIADDLVAANRVLVDRGILDGFGHVSARSAQDPRRFLISRNLAPASVERGDIQLLGFDCQPSDGQARYLEAFIHAEIYRARPDVKAIVHSHSEAVVPLSVAGVPLKPVLHMAGFLYPRPPVFEIRDTVGDQSDMLVRDAQTGSALAAALGDAAVVLMRGHGSTAVGGSVPEAVFRAVYTEVAAAALVTAHQLGTPTYLTEGEARAADATVASQIFRAWNYWRSQVGPRVLEEAAR